MSEAESTYQRIEAYLNGTLSSAERTAFQLELNDNPDLQKQLDLTRLAHELVFERRLLDIKTLASETHSDQGKNGKWKVAGLISTALILGGLAYLSIKEVPNEADLPKAASHKTEALTPTKTEPSKGHFQEEVVVTKKNYPQKGVTPSLHEISATQIEEQKTALSSSSLANEVEEKMPAVEKIGQPETSNPCATTKIEASIYTLPACIGEENGSISISQFKGGKSPYTTTLFDKNRLQVHSDDRLAAGNYHLVITDAASCSSNEYIIVKEKACEKHYHFNPFAGESWEIPVYPAHGSLSIFDKTGNVYFRKEIDANATANWSGESTDGEMKTGYFLFTITYLDGTVSRGSISIVR